MLEGRDGHKEDDRMHHEAQGPEEHRRGHEGRTLDRMDAHRYRSGGEGELVVEGHDSPFCHHSNRARNEQEADLSRPEEETQDEPADSGNLLLEASHGVQEQQDNRNSDDQTGDHLVLEAEAGDLHGK